MRRVIFTFFLLAISILLLGDFTEDFDGWLDASFGTVSTYDHAGVGQWENNNAMCHSTYARSGNAVRFNDDSTTILEYLLYKGLDGNGTDGGLGTISFWYRRWDTNISGEPVEFILEYQVGGTTGTWTTIGSSVLVTSTDYVEYSETANVPGDDIFFRVRNVQDKERLLIDDMTVTDYTGGGNQGPSIANISAFPTSPTNSQSVQISAEIKDLDGTISLAEIRWGTTSGNLTNIISMTLDSGDTYIGTVPQQSENTTVYYVVAATDDDTDETVSAESSYTVQSTGTPRVIFSEVTDPSDYNASYIELYNAGDGAQDLRGWTIKQYDYTWTTILDDTVNAEFETNMSGDYTLNPGEYVVLIRGTSADLLSTYPTFSGYYFVDGSNGAGVPQINNDEYFELYDTPAKAIVDRMGTYSDTILKDKVYERVDALTSGNDIGTDWTEVSASTTPGTPNQANIIPLGNDYGSLPVEFSYMTAEVLTNNSIGISWKTESESDLSYFLIHRGITEEYSNAMTIQSTIPASNQATGNLYQFIDTEVYSGAEYWYWVESVDNAGTTELYGPSYIKFGNGDEEPEVNVIVTGLDSIYPNPFNPSTTIKFSLKGSDKVTVSVFNLKGQEVRTLVDCFFGEGTHSVVWDGNDLSGAECSSGIYFIRVILGEITESRKAILMK
ncbi:MAG: lamin tail domain-containing protein [Candidatus Zophobacter franzmannii]|nr:lamin tail domain-containing protein [Candidatus Zophobacter franzmannii]